jgi:hypothetical protein
MRAICAALLVVAGCATAPPPERLAGCWSSENAGATRAMRWLPDPQRPDVLVGELVTRAGDGETQNVRYTLEPREARWVLCAHEENAAPRCREVAQGTQGSLEGGRAFIDRFGENLRISIIGDGPERVLFRGRRAGCD